MKTKTITNYYSAPECTKQYECALISCLHDIRVGRIDYEAEEKENWERIVSDAEISGDGLDYDGPLTYWVQ